MSAPEARESFASGIPPEAQVCRAFYYSVLSEEVQAAIAPASASELKQAARDLYRQLGDEKKVVSFFASPFNVNGCLGMVLPEPATKGLRCQELKGDRVHAVSPPSTSPSPTSSSPTTTSRSNRASKIRRGPAQVQDRIRLLAQARPCKRWAWTTSSPVLT